MGFVFKAVKSVVKAVVGVVKGVFKVIGGLVKGVLGFIRPKGNAANKATDQRLNKRLEPEDNRKIVFGETCGGADLRYWEVHGTDYLMYSEVLAVATHEIESFGDFYAEDDKLTFDGAGNCTAPDKYAGKVVRKTNNGHVGNAALAVGSGAYWNSTSKFTGCAHYSLMWGPCDQDNLPDGVPSRYTQVIKGAKVYDPRKDSTVGGIGTMRYDDQSTWAYATLDSNGQPLGRNNALQMLWYLLGWRINGVLVAGRGVDPNDINWSDWIAAANDAEALDLYTDMILSTGDDHETNEGIISADGLIGELLDPGGLWTYKIVKDDTADVAVTLGEDDVVLGGDVSWTPIAPMSDQFNEVAGSYIDPSATSLYQAKSYPVVTDAAYKAADGFTKRQSHNYQCVQDVSLAQRLSRIKLNRARFTGTFKATFNYRALKAQVWSIVKLNVSHYGFSNSIFRVLSQSVTESGIEMVLREDNPTIYAGGTVVVPPAPSQLPKYDIFQKVPLWMPAIQAITTTNAAGTTIPGIRLTWTATGVNVSAIEGQFRKVGSTVWLALGAIDKADTSVDQVGLLSNTSYEARLRTRSLAGVYSDWQTVGPVSTGQGGITWGGGELIDIPANLAGLVGTEAIQNQDILDSISNDNVLSAAEKRNELIPLAVKVENRYQQLLALAASTSLSTSAMTTARANWLSLLDGYGKELVANGTFAVDTTGWTTNGTMAAVGGRMRVTKTSTGTAYGQQNIAVVVGKRYRITATAITGTCQARFRAGYPGNSVAYGEFVNSTQTIDFVAVDPTVQILCYAYDFTTAGLYAEFDDISVKELPVTSRWNDTDADTTLYEDLLAGLSFPADWTVLNSAIAVPNGAYLTLSDQNAAGVGGFQEQQVSTGVRKYTFGLVVKKDAVPSATRSAAMRLWTTGGASPKQPTLVFDTSTGAVGTANNMSAADEYGSLDLGDDWLFWLTVTSSADDTTLSAYVYAAWNASGSLNVGANSTVTGSIDVRGAPLVVQGDWRDLGREMLRARLGIYEGELVKVAGQLASWSTIASRPGNLSALTGSEGINNLLVSIGSNGALSGGGGGQVTFGGLGGGALGLRASLGWSDGLFTGRPGNLAALVGTEGIRNDLVSIGSNGALSGGGGGQVTFTGLGGGALGLRASLGWSDSLFTGRPGNLSALVGSEGINNALVSIGSNGALSGGGGGQVTFDGLGGGARGDANRVRFSMFESGVRGWVNRLGSATVYTEVGSNGLTRLRLDATITGTNQKQGLSTAWNGGSGQRPYWIPVTEGERIYAGAHVAVVGLSSGQRWILQIGFLDASGAAISGGSYQVGQGLGGATVDQDVYGFTTVPAGAVFAFLELYLDSLSTTSGGVNMWLYSPMVCGASAGQTAAPSFTPGPSGDYGATLGATAGVGGNITNDVTVPGSGARLPDGRATPSNRNFGLRSTYSNLTLTGSDAGSTASIAISSSTWNTDWGTTITFPSATLTGLAFSTKYFIWRVQADPTTAGTSYGYSTNINDALGTGKTYLGTCTTPADGGASTGGSGPGTGDCVHPDAWVEMWDGSFKQARDVGAGDRIVALDEEGTGTRAVEVESNILGENDRVRLTTESGITVTLSINTPLTLRDGSLAIAANATGHELPVKDEGGFRWERCVGVQYEMFGAVSHIRCHQATYAAGDERGRSVLTHNPKP